MSKVTILKPQGSYADIPFYSGHISAGFPGVVEEHLEGALSLDQLLIKNQTSTFFARVEGDSMIGAGIFQNDMLVIDRSYTASHKDIVVALVNNEFTVKRLCTRGGLRLQAENSNYEDIPITGETELIIWGVVTGVARSLK